MSQTLGCMLYVVPYSIQSVIHIMHIFDYSRNLMSRRKGVVSIDNPEPSNHSPLAIQFCHQLNMSLCPCSESHSTFLVNIYNPMSRELRNHYIRIPVPTPQWEVYGPQGIAEYIFILIQNHVLFSSFHGLIMKIVGKVI